jgi:hypothetical protein
MPDAIAEAEDIETTFIWFAETILGEHLYEWQEDVVSWFDNLSLEMVLGSIATPNGSGKSSKLIPTLVLGLLFFYPNARVVLTTADGKQLDGQVMPAINAHRAKFPDWKFIEREVITPTGGRFIGFTTTESGRAEGWHKLDDDDGPLLIIVDEAKSVDEGIFQAIHRCTYNGLLLTSSPGKMTGQFYESQFKPELGFNALRVGLKDCPHITPDKIDRILKMYGPNSPYTRSTLHGEFLEINKGDPVYYAYSMEAHERKELGWPHGATLVVGMDGGTHNASVIMAVKEDSNRRTHIWVLREIILTGSDTDRQAVELLKVLAEEFPWWNSLAPICPQTLFFCDPALRNSAYTSRGPNASALKVLHSHGIYPGYKIGLGLQPSIAIGNRIMQQHHMVETIDFSTGEKSYRAVWHFQIDKKKCPTLAAGLRGRYRYPVEGEPDFGKDVPMKGSGCNHVDHVCDGARYGWCNVLAIAEETHPDGMRSAQPERANPEPARKI